MGKIQKKKRSKSHDAIRSKLASSINPKEVIRNLAKLKCERTYGETKLVLQSSTSPLIPKCLGSALFTQSWDELYTKSPWPESSNWVQETGWIVHSLSIFSSQLRNFIVKRQQFGKNFVTGNYSESERILEEIETNFGKSFWLLERKLMLSQLSGGFEAQKKLLCEILNETTLPIVKFSAFAFSSRIEDHVTFTTYSEQIQSVIDSLNAKGKPRLADLIEFQAHPWSSNWTRSVDKILHKLLGRPLIDRYNYLIKLLTYKTKDFTISLSDRYHLQKILHDLLDYTQDLELANLCRVMGFTRRSSVFDDESKNFIHAHDLLITGQYEEAKKESLQLLRDNPISFDNYHLFAQVHAASGSLITTEFRPKTIAYEIATTLTRVVSNSSNVDISLEILSKLATTLGENNIGLTLWKFVTMESSEINIDSIDRYCSVLGKNCVAGTSLNLFGGVNSELETLFRDTNEAGATSQVFAYKNGKDFQIDLLKPPILDPIIRILKSMRVIEKTQFADAIKLLNTVVFSNIGGISSGGIYQMIAAEILFKARMLNGDFLDASNEVIEIFSKNPNNLRHVPFQQIIELGKSGAAPEIVASINWPILIHLSNGSAQDLYEATDDYFNAIGISSPREFLARIGENIGFKDRIFIRRILLPEVLERSPFWTTSREDQRALRAELLRKLYDPSESDQEEIFAELSVIERARILEDDYRNVEGPKFILSFPDIDREYLSLLETIFARYLAYRTYEEAGGKLESQEDLFTKLTTESTKAEFEESSISTHETKAGTVSCMILENSLIGLFNAYLWDSKSSINSILGTRIRHGSLDNQITRAFETAGLLASADENSTYQCSDEFLERLDGIDDNHKSLIITEVIRFTERVQYIIIELLEKLVRIKVPSKIEELLAKSGLPLSELAHSEGLLDVSRLFFKEEIDTYIVRHSPNSVADLVKLGSAFFEEVLSNALHQVAVFFDSSVAPAIVDALEELESVVNAASGDNEVRLSILNQIASARDAFGRDIHVIMAWFAVAKNVSRISGSCKNLMEMAFRVVNFATGERLGELEWSQVHDCEIRGVPRVLLYEVMLILLRNVARHSALENHDKILCAIKEIGHGRLEVTFENYVSPSVDIVDAIQRAQECIKNPEGSRLLGQGGGKTGLRRIPILLNQFGSGGTRVSVVSRDDFGRSLFQVKVEFGV